MKTLVVVVLTAALVIGLGVTAFGYVVLLDARKETASVQRDLAGQWARFESAVMADEARWRDDLLIAPHGGGDAGPLLFRHVGLQDGLPKVPKLFKPGLQWVDEIDGFDTSKLDLEWMRELKNFGYWEIAGPGTPLENVPVSVNEPPIAFADLQTFAKARLVRGIQNGDAREAAAEVRELARLCLTTEHLVGAMVGVALVLTETRAFDEATKRGQVTTGWVPYSSEDGSSLRRVVFVAPAPYSLLATPTLSTTRLPVGACVGLHEGMWQLHNSPGMRAAFASRYSAIDYELGHTPCRLPRMRKAWAAIAGVQAPVQDGVQLLPFANETIANQTSIITGPSRFRAYK